MDSLAALPWWGLAWVLAVVLLSGFFHGLIGFGYPIIAMPLLALVLDIRTAILVSLVPTLVLTLINVFHGGRLRESVARFWFMPLAQIAGSYLGTRILIGADPAPFVLLLIFSLVAYLNIDRLGRLEFSVVKNNPRAWGIGFGLVAGVFEATANVSGPVLLVYFMMLGLSPAPLVQLLNFTFVGGKGAQILTWSVSGGIGLEYWLSTLPLAAAAVATLVLGTRIRKRVDAATYVGWLRKFLWAMVVLLLVQFARSMFFY
jgi:uncharacterized membrane protein YfcA